MMLLRAIAAIFAVGFAVQAEAGFSSINLTVSGDSQVGSASVTASANNRAGFLSVAGSDADSVNGETGPLPGPTGSDSLDTSTQVGVLTSDQRRAGTTATASGTPDSGATISMLPSSFAQVLNGPNTSVNYKGEAISTVTFVGEILANAGTLPGVAISYDANYSMQAFAQNNAPGGFNNNSAYSAVQAVLTVENMTAGTTAGSVAFIDDFVSQTYCGPQGSCFPNNSFDMVVDGTLFVPFPGVAPGDVLRMTIEATAMTDVYGKGFQDPSGGSQTAGGLGFARFDSLDIELLVIPEPGSLALALVGTASVLCIRRFRRNAAV